VSSSEIMRKLSWIVAAALVAAAPFTGVRARQDPGKPAAPAAVYELIVFEADGCVYCQDFRTRIQPLYTASALGREAPLRYVNVSRSDETKMGLSGAITIAPTIVLMHNGLEVDRIVGYTGPGDFMKLVAHMMGR
jgi:thioredoxin-related protein